MYMVVWGHLSYSIKNGYSSSWPAKMQDSVEKEGFTSIYLGF